MLSGLKLIVTYNRIIGNTFFGWIYDDESKNKWKPILLKLWNVCLMVILSLPLLFVGLEYVDTEKDYLGKNITNQELSKKFDLPHLLYLVIGINFLAQSLVVALYLAFVGPKLMTILAEEKAFGLIITV